MLDNIYERFSQSILVAGQCASMCSGNGYDLLGKASQERAATGILVRIHDEWSQYCRSLVLLSASSNVITANGRRIPRVPSIKSRTDALTSLMNSYKSQRHEPKWYDAASCIDAANRLKIPGGNTIFEDWLYRFRLVALAMIQ